MGEQSVSAQALVDAKNELLALQDVVHQKDADILSLHDTMRQRNGEVEQLAARLDAATRDYTVAHEESRQLREKLRQYEEALVTERAEHSAILNELRGESAIVERESARLALERLHKENEELRRRELQSVEVVGRLMADVEAGHRTTSPKLATTVATYTKEEHDADVERQLLVLRAELEEMFGEDISRMKEQMRDQYSATVDQLQRDLARSEEERSRFAGQASLWQQQYMVLSQQGVSAVDITQQLNDAIADNVLQRQRVAELTAEVEQLNAQLSSSHTHSSSQARGSELSYKLEEYKREIAEKVSEESRSLRSKVDELNSILSDARKDRDQSIARCQSVEQELETLREELLSARSRHNGELQQIEAKAASDVAELAPQLASAKEQPKTVQFASVEAISARDEMERALREKQSQFEMVKKDYEHRIEQLKTENANAVERVSNEYTKHFDSERAKMAAVVDEYQSRDQKSLALIEELKMKYEILKKESRAVSEQVQHQAGQMQLNADILATPSAAVWGASDVDSVVAHLSSQLEKVTRERDSAMQSLQTIYGDRIELQQTIKVLESERSALATRASHLDTERQSLGEQLTHARSELSRLKYSAVGRSATSLSSVGTGSIPNMPSVTDEADGQGPDVIDSLRAEFEELQRLRRERDRSSSTSAIMASGSAVSTVSHTEVNVNLNVASAAEVNQTGDDSASGEEEEMLSAEELVTLKQEYSALCAELVRLREMLITLQRVDREREQVRSQFEQEIRLLRDELLRRDKVDTAAVTETVEAALGDRLQERDAEIDSLKGRLAMTLSRMEELIAEKDQQCAAYEHELEEVHEEHSSALKRIDALVQEHNILIGGQVPLSSVSPENVREMPVVIHAEILENVDEDLSPKRMAYENQAKEIEHLREQLQQAAEDIESLSVERDRLNEALESNTAELLASLDKAASENKEQQQVYERKLATYTQDIEQLNRKLDTVSAELEQSRSAHLSEMEKLREEYQVQFNELSFNNEESNREHQQELCAVQKHYAEMQARFEEVAAEKASMEQEYVTALQDVTKENSARISALREGFEQDLAQVHFESEKAYGDHAVQLEEELNQSRQEVAQLKQSLELFEGGTHHPDRYETGDLETVQVLQLRINDLTETKDELQQRLDAVASENERLVPEVEALQLEKENLRSQILALPQDYSHGFYNLDVESVADTSGESHIFYTPAKSKKTLVEKMKSLQAEKEILTNMVERLNAEKEQLKSHLIVGHQPAHVFEADIRHLELRSPEVVEVSQVENGAEVRMIALESEKELLAGMLEKLSCENEQLTALMMAGNDNVLDTSYEDALSDINNVDKSGILDAYEEPELTVDEVVTLRYEHAVMKGKLADMERQVSSVNMQPTGEQETEEKVVMEMVHSSVQTDICHVDEGMLTALEQSDATSDVEHLYDTIRHVTHERDVAHAEMLAIKKGICTVVDHSVPADDSLPEMSADSLLAALDVFIHQATDREKASSQESVSELQSQIAKLHSTNESVLTEVRKILYEIDPLFLPDSANENWDVDTADAESEALIVALRLLKERRASAGASADTPATSEQALLLESMTEERDRLYRELENARQQLLEVQPYRETMSVDNEQTIGSLINQINQLVQQKNELEELVVKKAESGSHDREADVNWFRAEDEAAGQDLEARQTLVDSSVQVDLLREALEVDSTEDEAAGQDLEARRTLVDSSVQVDLLRAGLEVDSVNIQPTLETPVTKSRTEDSFEQDQSENDLSLSAEEVESRPMLAENIRVLEERLSTVTVERDKLSADLSHVLQQLVELKASQADLTGTTKSSVEVLRNELDIVMSEREVLAECEAATQKQLAKVKVERDELSCKVDALQDALKLAVEERDQYIHSRSAAEAQLPGSTVSVAVPAQMEYGVSDESSAVENELAKNNAWLQARVKELEVVQHNLLDEKQAVLELYSKTVDELKARLVEMQATVESLKSEMSAKSQENEAVVEDLMSRLQAAEIKSSDIDEDHQKLLNSAESACEEKQKIIDELTSTLESVIVRKSDDDNEMCTEVLLVSKVDFLKSEVSRLSKECDQLSSSQIAAEHEKAEALPQCEDGTLVKELQLPELVMEEAGTDFVDTRVSELQQVDITLSVARHSAAPQTTEQCTMTEESAFLGIDHRWVDDVNVDSGSAGTLRLDEDVSSLQKKLQMLTAELETVTEQRDDIAAKLSELEHSVGKLAVTADIADMAVQTDGLLMSEEATCGQIRSGEAIDRKECYLRIQSRHHIAVSDDVVNVRNVRDESAVGNVDVAVETDVPAEQNVCDHMQVKLDELLDEAVSLKEERDEIRQQLLQAESCLEETQARARDKVKALQDELASLREELCHFQTRSQTLDSEQWETAQTWQVKNQELTEALHTIRVERDSLSAELELAKRDLDACERSCSEKTSAAENCIVDLRSELASLLQMQQELTDELNTCKIHLEARTGDEAKLSMLIDKCNELEAALITVEQERDALKEESIVSRSQLEELQCMHEQTAASMKSKSEDLEVQLAAVKDENTTLTRNCNVAIDEFTDLKNTQVEIESKLKNHIEDLEGQVRSLSGDLEKAGLNLLAAERQYEELQQSLTCTNADAARKFETLSSELQNSIEEKSELIIKLANVDSTCAELKSQLEATLEDRNGLMIRLREAESERTELRNSVAGHQEALVSIESLEKECCRLSEENKCLNERCDASELASRTSESQLDDQQQKTSSLQTENDELRQIWESLLSENGALKQQISEYIEKVSTCTSSEQLAHESWTCKEEQLLSKIKGLEADLCAREAENSMLKSEVDRIPLLTAEVASIAAERDDAHKRCVELETEVVKLREDVEDLNKKFELTSTELTETKAELTKRCEEAECQVDRLKKLANEKSSCVLDLKSALERTQEELAESQKERESLFHALASERNAAKEETAANEAAMTEVKSRLSSVEKEFALKCEKLQVAEDRILQQQSAQQHAGSVDGDIEAVQQECDHLRALVASCQLDANTAREKLSQMEGLCRGLAAERDELVKDRCTLHAEKDERSHELLLLQQQLEQVAADTDEGETEALEQQVVVEQLGVAPRNDVKQAVGDDSMVQDEQNIVYWNAKMLAVESELKNARETVQRLQEEVDSLRQENENLKQIRQVAEDSLNTVMQELAASQPDTARRLQEELTGERSSRSTEGWEEFRTRVRELDALTEVETDISSAADSTGNASSVHASTTYTKLAPSNVAAHLTTAETEAAKVPPGSPLEGSVHSSLVYASRTFTKLTSMDAAACQTDAEMVAGKLEADVSDLNSQINRLQLELEQQKLSHIELVEKLQADCVGLTKARDMLMQENSFLNEQLKQQSAGVETGSVMDYGTIQSRLRSEIEAETKQHYESEMEALETEYREKLAVLKDECDRRVTAAENGARAKILECSASETSVVESESSLDGDSTQMSDIISQRDELKSYLAEKTKQVTELHNEIERLREENKKEKMPSLAIAAVAESMEPYCKSGVDSDEERQRIIANLENQLLRSTEENKRLQQNIAELTRLTKEVNAVHQKMEEQHLTEIKVLEFRLQESYKQHISRMRKEVEAELEETYKKRKEALDAEFKKKSEKFRKETEHKFVQELKKVCSHVG